ncbi:MAG: 4-phosphoerythronate dehydrogenase [Chitinispirillaceae bacterium]
MKIVADQNIYSVENAFSDCGTVLKVPSYKITRSILQDAQALLVRSVTPVNQELLEGTAVKFVASVTIGVDHVDLDYLRENNIGFAHAPGSNADSVAEYVVAAIFQTALRMNRDHRELRVGVVGAGNVGGRVCRLARVLGMDCLLNDPPKRDLTGQEIYLPLGEVLENSDIVSLHVPLTTTDPYPTYHMVNSEFVKRMKKGAALINTSRGKVVDEQSFRTVRDHLGVVVLDVFGNEPSINPDTMKLADIATPHVAGYSLDGKLRGTEMIYESMCAFFFKTPSWSADTCALHTERVDLDLRASSNPLYDAVAKAYPIMEDDEQFRQLFSVQKDQQARFFEELRRNYPRRLEFSHFTVLIDEKQKMYADVLRDLRFTVVTRGDKKTPEGA